MTYKGFCPNCGAKLQITYASNGTMIMFCPHVPAHVVQTGIGQMRHMEIYCNNGHNGTGKKHGTVQKSTAIYEHKKEAELYGKIEAEREAFETLIKDTGVTFQTFKEATNNTVSEDKLLEYANLSILLICDAGVPVNALPKLFNASMKLGYALGINTEAAIRALAIGVGRQSRLVLDNIGIVFHANSAYAWFKREFPDKEFDSVNAWKQYAIKEIIDKAAKLQISGKPKTRFEALHAHIKNGKAKIGKEAMNA